MRGHVFPRQCFGAFPSPSQIFGRTTPAASPCAPRQARPKGGSRAGPWGPFAAQPRPARQTKGLVLPGRSEMAAWEMALMSSPRSPPRDPRQLLQPRGAPLPPWHLVQQLPGGLATPPTATPSRLAAAIGARGRRLPTLSASAAGREGALRVPASCGHVPGQGASLLGAGFGIQPSAREHRSCHSECALGPGAAPSPGAALIRSSGAASGVPCAASPGPSTPRLSGFGRRSFNPPCGARGAAPGSGVPRPCGHWWGTRPHCGAVAVSPALALPGWGWGVWGCSRECPLSSQCPHVPPGPRVKLPGQGERFPPL